MSLRQSKNLKAGKTRLVEDRSRHVDGDGKVNTAQGSRKYAKDREASSSAEHQQDRGMQYSTDGAKPLRDGKMRFSSGDEFTHRQNAQRLGKYATGDATRVPEHKALRDAGYTGPKPKKVRG